MRQFELDADGENVAVIDDGSDNLVVIGEQVVVESFGVWIAAAGRLDHKIPTAQQHCRRTRQPTAAIIFTSLPVSHFESPAKGQVRVKLNLKK